VIDTNFKYYYVIQDYYKSSINEALEKYHLNDDNAADPEVFYGRIEGQDSECWSFIDDYKRNMNNKEVISELNSIIHKQQLKITKDSKEYILLYKGLLLAKIDVCLKKVELFKTGSFTPNEYDKSLETVEIKKPINKGREERPSTYNKRVIINSIAKRMREKSPSVTKGIIAQDVADEFNKKHSNEFGRKLTPGAILKDYSDNL